MGRIGELHMWVGKCLSPKRCCQCFGKSCVKKVSTKLLIFVFSLCGLCLLWVAGRLWVNGVAGAQWNVCKLAAKVTRGWQLSPDFPSKQRRGTAAEPGSGPQRHGHWAWLCSVDDNNTLVMFSLLDLSSYGRGGEKVCYSPVAGVFLCRRATVCQHILISVLWEIDFSPFSQGGFWTMCNIVTGDNYKQRRY